MVTLLVTGASQGASSLNALMVAFALKHRDLLSHWQVLHLAGPRSSPSAAELDAGYARAGVRALVLPFLNEMGLAWGAAELALSRAGANSVAEAEANRVPTVFVPYPYHADLHQEANAKPLVDDGAAVLAYDKLDVTANLESIGRPLEALMADGRTAAPAVFVTGGWGPALLPALDGAVAMPDLVPAGIATACDPAVD